jgi:nitroreductase
MDIVKIVLQCGIHAPTARHCEPWAIRVVADAAALEKFDGAIVDWMRKTGHAALQFFQNSSQIHVLYHAPLLVVIAGDRGAPLAQVDCILAMENILLAAHSFGIGSCIIASVAEFLKNPAGKEWEKMFQIPKSHEPVIATVLGYSDQEEWPTAVRDGAKIVFVDGEG